MTIAALLIVVGALALLTRFSELGPRPPRLPRHRPAGRRRSAWSPRRSPAAGPRARRPDRAGRRPVRSRSSPPRRCRWHNVRGGVGDRTFRPATAAQVRDVYRGGVGDMTVDLTPGRPSATSTRPITTRIEHGLGDVAVLVPARRRRPAHASMSGVGSIDAFGQGRSTAASSRAPAPALGRRRPGRVRHRRAQRRRRRGGVPWLTTASSRPRRPAGRNGRREWEPGVAARHPAGHRGRRPPKRRVDLGAADPGPALHRPGGRADDRRRPPGRPVARRRVRLGRC